MTLLDSSAVDEAKLAAEQLSPRGGRRLTPPRTWRRSVLNLIFLAFVAACLYCIWWIGANPYTFWAERQDIINLLERMVPPRIDEPRIVWRRPSRPS